MEFDHYFPLFNDIMHGRLNPELSENAEAQDYSLRIEQQIRAQDSPAGRYAFHYLKSFNLKCVYYSQLLISETNLYCEDAIAYFPTETDSRIRCFLRDQILDKHLTTCLERIGETIKVHEYRLEELEHPAANADRERLSNIYIYHLLKVCVAKAYLELQEQLADVVAWKRSEEMLYLGVVKEIQPVKRFLLKQKKAASPNYEETATGQVIKSGVVSERDNNVPKPKLIDSKQVMIVLGVSESSLYRLKKNNLIPAPIKIGKKDMYDEQLVYAYLHSLSMQ